MSQFATVIGLLKKLEAGQQRILDKLEAMDSDLFDEGYAQYAEEMELTEAYVGEIRNQSGEDYEPGLEVKPRVTPSTGATRTHAEVRNLDGGIDYIPWTDIDERVIEAYQLDKEYRRNNPDAVLGPCVLYLDPQGNVRISIDEAVASLYRKQHTYQQPVPREGRGPSDDEVFDSARPKD